MSIDLRPYGIDHTFTSASDVDHFLPEHITTARLQSPYLYYGARRFTIGGLIGKGTYGITLAAYDDSRAPYAIKVVPASQFIDVFNETLIQILLERESRMQPDGPYVPSVIGLGVDIITDDVYVITERMTGTLQDLLASNSPETNVAIVDTMLEQISNALRFFGKRLKFNHRDLKDDNIMYVKRDNKYYFKMIDFGFSCLMWNGLRLRGNTYFSDERPCYREDRDLAQLVYHLYLYDTKLFTPEFNGYLASLLKAKHGKTVCNMRGKCKGLGSWETSYNFLDRNNVSVPKVKLSKFTRRKKKI
jgi:serine/threonine protein kinase